MAQGHGPCAPAFMSLLEAVEGYQLWYHGCALKQSAECTAGLPEYSRHRVGSKSQGLRPLFCTQHTVERMCRPCCKYWLFTVKCSPTNTQPKQRSGSHRNLTNKDEGTVDVGPLCTQQQHQQFCKSPPAVHVTSRRPNPDRQPLVHMHKQCH